MKHLLLIYIILLVSCKKENGPKPSAAGVKKVTINQLTVKQYDNIAVAASAEGFSEGDVWRRGFTWSLSPYRRVGDSVYKVYGSQPFSATINGMGQNSRIYIRAFVETALDTYYSDSMVINTSGVQVLWMQQHNGPKRRIRKVVSSGAASFMALAERIDGFRSWPQLIQFDTSGNIMWERDYYSNDIKTPQYMQPVFDGYLIACSQGLSRTGGIVLLKTDLNGQKIWEQVCTRQTYENFVRLIVLPNQNIQLTTRSYNLVNNQRVNTSIDDYLFTADGQLLVGTAVPNTGSFGKSLDPFQTFTAADGGFVSVSEAASAAAGGIVVNKFNNAYQMTWEQFGLRSSGRAVDLQVNSAGNYLIKGVQSSNAVVMELDKNSGELLWQYDFDSWKYEAAFGEGKLAVGNDGYYMAADSRLFLRYEVHGPLLVKLGVNGEYLYDCMVAVPDALHYTDVVLTNGNKEIWLFGTLLQNANDRAGALYVLKLEER